MEIITAKNSGFCKGVRRAVNKALKALEQEDKGLYSLGPLVHNPQVVEWLAGKGLNKIKSLEGINKGIIIIRSHGEGLETFRKIEEKGLDFIDATCQRVKRLQELARGYYQNGYRVVIVGDRDHPEIKGVVSWTEGSALVIGGASEAERLAVHEESMVLLSQTTLPEEKLRSVEEVLKTKTNKLVTHNTICPATRLRQQAAVALAKKVDVMIVIGGYNSSNTQKLAQLCRQTGTLTYHIEQADELCLRWFDNINRVGVTAGASTPDWIIEEVVRTMEEWNDKKIPDSDSEEEKPLQEDSSPLKEPEGTAQEQDAQLTGVSDKETCTEPKELNQESEDENIEQERENVEVQLTENIVNLRKGEIIKGKVVEIRQDEVLVDVGGKSEGIIPLPELSRRRVENPREVVEIGDEIEVFVIRPENEDGNPILSKRRAERKQAWERLENAFEKQEEISAEVVEVVKGGLLVDVGVNGFVPASLVERGYVEDLEAYVGKNLRLKVIELDRNKNKVVLSRKAILDEEYENKKRETWDNLEEGQVVNGVVRRITDFGAFVDIGGVDGLLHVSEISWGRVDHPRSVLKVGQGIDVKVLGVNKEEGKVSLGLKQLQPNPWETASEKYKVGEIVEGKVLRIAPFGAFVEVEPGIEGLVHISQLADYHVAKPEDVVSVGEVIPVKILSVDDKAQRMSLSLREARGKNTGEQDEKDKEKETQPEDNKAAETGVKLGDLFSELFEENKVQENKD